jgi:endonuclease/exonuclease/phosphatase family metal-dependent hydrolase
MSTANYPQYNVFSYTDEGVRDHTIVSLNCLSNIPTGKDIFELDVSKPTQANEFAAGDVRLPKLTWCLEDWMSKALIICLQEVSPMFMRNILKVICPAKGYEFAYHPQEFRKFHTPVDGNTSVGECRLGLAILWPTARYTSVSTARIVAFKGPEVDKVKLGEIEASMGVVVSQLRNAGNKPDEKQALAMSLAALKKAKDAVLKVKGDPIGPPDRGLLFAELKSKDDVIAVATLHAPCKHFDPVLMGEFAKAYKKALAEYVERRLPLVICGDMNSESGTPFTDAMLQGDFTDAMAPARGPKSCTCYAFNASTLKSQPENPKPKQLTVDHAFTSPEVKLVKVMHPELTGDIAALPNEHWASDHLPIILTVRTHE